MSREKEVIKVVRATISLINNQYSSLVELLGVLNNDVCVKEVGKEEPITAYERWLQNTKWEEGKQTLTTSFLGKTTDIVI